MHTGAAGPSPTAGSRENRGRQQACLKPSRHFLSQALSRSTHHSPGRTLSLSQSAKVIEHLLHSALQLLSMALTVFEAGSGCNTSQGLRQGHHIPSARHGGRLSIADCSERAWTQYPERGVPPKYTVRRTPSAATSYPSASRTTSFSSSPTNGAEIQQLSYSVYTLGLLSLWPSFKMSCAVPGPLSQRQDRVA